MMSTQTRFVPRLPALTAVLGALLLLGCELDDRPIREAAGPAVEVVNEYPHDRGAFTQGLVYHHGYLFESTGLRGESSLRRVELETGNVLQRIDLDDEYFGEGITIMGDRIFQLTWQENTGFVYDLDTFELVDTFSYEGEGWGLTNDGESLIMSDGTYVLRFLDPDGLEVTRRLEVRDRGARLREINELQYVNGEIYANIFRTDYIVRIDPATGEVLGWIDLVGLLPPGQRTGEEDVLNGIAYDPQGDRLFVTGKLWPTVFEIGVPEEG